MLEQEVIERCDNLGLVTDDPVPEVVAKHQFTVAVETRVPRELKQLMLELGTPIHQLRNGRHPYSRSALVEEWIQRYGHDVG